MLIIIVITNNNEDRLIQSGSLVNARTTIKNGVGDGFRPGTVIEVIDTVSIAVVVC